MEFWDSAELVADALGGLTSEGSHAVGRVLSYLGVSLSYKEAQGPKLTIHIERASPQEDESVEFDPSSKTWRVVEASPSILEAVGSGNEQLRRSHPNGAELSNANSDHQDSPSSISPHVRVPGEDWTTALPDTDHVKFLKSIEWDKTALGPMRDWSEPLRLMTEKMLADPRSACLYWGESRIAIYNEPFIILAQSRHPILMGSTAEKALPATWPFLRPLFEEIERTGTPFSNPDFEMMVYRDKEGFLEECHYDGVWIPIRGRSGKIEGFYNSGHEITRLKILDRRSRLLRLITAVSDFHIETPWQHIIEACRPFERDIPMLALYSATVDGTPPSMKCRLHLQGTLGIESSSLAIPDDLEIHDAEGGFLPELRAAYASGSPVLVDMSRDGLPALLEGVKWRGFEVPSHVIIVIPVFVTGMVAGFLIAGMNPRRPYDDDHKEFARDLGRVSTGAVAASISFEQAQARERQLTLELTGRERFIRKLTEVASVGIYALSNEGALIFANQRYYEITGISDRPEDSYNMSVLNYADQDDQAQIVEVLGKAISEQRTTVLETRLKRKWTPPGTNEEQPCWILASAIPDVQGGEVVGVLGCITDIKELKWSEQLQRNAADAAKEAKRLQEKFIDTTSHEMRNPLSAIMQCADGIGNFLERARRSREHDLELMDILDNINENSSTVLFCAAHQKRIIDDILTVSKLDSSMLAVTPILVQPTMVVRQCMQMFDAELVAANITSAYVLEPTYEDLHVTWVHCDPSRLTQVIINLLTNAIKFTKLSANRHISVKVGASTAIPPAENVQWFPSAQLQHSTEADVRTKDEVYITIQVVDTGKGISADEMSLLFKRFAQANPKTHIQYGGSGLGLFISRELTELQHGMMGASSVPGEGSTFAFYIKARRATALEIAHQQYSSNGKKATLKRSLTSNATRRSSAPTSQHKIILIVEDNVLNQRVLSKQLQRLGCTVHIANHGLEALEFLKRTRFWRENKGEGEDLTVMLMDWEMPVMDGLTATRKIRELEEQELLTEHLAIIATTANARDEQVRMAYDAGVDDLLAKPFTVSQVMKKIEILRDQGNMSV